ncbi:SGNH/GDSL hydrolase family protein [Sphingomonas phyllosphaerae]|uniref:SGNH/GDSL hydrolase family protein n=1 Tax=Sphingomonas phyllosphaerae TaxID=257003 RepID=UPI0003B5F16D|nr:GDSL-type esterase/lipase family protein [Sphingomonas phyllosphaerae]
MTRTSGSIGGAVSAASLARVGAPVPAVERAAPTALLAWAAARGRVRTGMADAARIAFVGDSKTMGAGAGTGAGTAGAFARSRPARVAALLAAGGLPIRGDSFFGCAGLGSIAEVLAYDPRRSGFSGWSGGSNSLGGAALSASNGNPGKFQPAAPVDRCSVFIRSGTDRPAFTVAKGGESVTLVPAGAVGGFARLEASFTTRDASPIVVTRTGPASNLQLVGMVAWDSTRAGIEVANFGVFGVTSAFQADTSAAFSPAAALAVYAPHLTVVNLGTNDIAQNLAMATWLANVRAIVQQARASGSVILTWPAVGGSAPTGGPDALRAQWRTALRALAFDNDCLFVDEEALLGGRAVAQASGAFADGLHETAWAYDVQAAAIARAIL